MKLFFKKIYAFLLLVFCTLPQQGYAQQAYVGDDEINTIFVSGGYGALFGAAMGAAILPFMNGTPMQNFRTVAGGASIGFMVGSAYGFYTIANINKNSYFNYNTQDEDNYYYSMPPTMPTQGSNFKNKAIKKQVEDKNQAPVVGALFMGNGKNINLAIPYFWVAEKQVSVMLAYLNF